jgi:hypothetical protein
MQCEAKQHTAVYSSRRQACTSSSTSSGGQARGDAGGAVPEGLHPAQAKCEMILTSSAAGINRLWIKRWVLVRSACKNTQLPTTLYCPGPGYDPTPLGPTKVGNLQGQGGFHRQQHM